jgi:hypothetical protein
MVSAYPQAYAHDLLLHSLYSRSNLRSAQPSLASLLASRVLQVQLYMNG